MQKVRYRIGFNNLYIKFQVLFHSSFIIAFNLSFTLLITIDARYFSLRNWFFYIQLYKYILQTTQRLQTVTLNFNYQLYFKSFKDILESGIDSRGFLRQELRNQIGKQFCLRTGMLGVGRHEVPP